MMKSGLEEDGGPSLNQGLFLAPCGFDLFL